MAITGSTAVIGLIGTPIVQVRMPSLMNPYFGAHGIDAVLVPMDVAPDAIPALVQTARRWSNLAGIIITVPYKQVMAPLADRLTDRARRFSTVNAVRRETDGTLSGEMFDGVGFVEALAGHGMSLAGKRAAVIGAGGVACAIANSLCESGVARLRIQDVDATRQDRLIAILREAFPSVDITAGIGSVADLDLLVNATPVGMNGDPSLPLPAVVLAGLAPSCFVADVVTVPVMTPFLSLAREKGCRVQTGPEMTETQLLPLARFLGVAA
ncbi:MAG: shikimate dehydrogenase [Acetobacteraceae bacterium]